MENNHFTQLIKEPTKIRVNTSTLMDHIFTSHPGKVHAVKFPKIGLSVYFPTILSYKDSFGKKAYPHIYRVQVLQNVLDNVIDLI